MGNKSKKEGEKFNGRKMRIRLADPNVPDSYVCEIFDSSLENSGLKSYSNSVESVKKQNESSANYSGSDENDTPNGEAKPKNYFEILMSKESRKNLSGLSAKENEEISEKTKVLKISDKEEYDQKNKEIKQRTNDDLTNWENCKKKENEYYSELYDESLFKVQRQSRGNGFVKTEINEISDSPQKLNSNDSESENGNLNVNFECSKEKFLRKKKSGNILRYFSKVGSVTSQKIKKKSKPKKLNGVLLNETLVKQKIEWLKDVEGMNGETKSVQSEKRKSLNYMNKENIKLAPLFQKKEKRVFDAATQKARLEFLQNGLAVGHKKAESFKSIDNFNSFPPVCHVQQRNDCVFWSVRDISLPCFRFSNEDNFVFNVNKTFSFNVNESKSVITKVVNNSLKVNKELINELKKKYQDLNFSLVIDGLKQKRDNFVKKTKEVEKLLEKNPTIEESRFEIFNTLWTEKYKPSSCEIVGNDNTVRKLRNWLQSWKVFNEELKNLVKTKKLKDQEGTDEDDFIRSDDENFGLKVPGNVCLISGPNGCGKTSLVFALANELEFNVLEVNASLKRTGKKVLTDLQEATQSHKVRHFNVQRPDIVAKGKKKKSKKVKKKIKEIDKSLDQTNNSKISLILIEDADIVFEDHDEGFFSAISSLVQTSKRPIIFLANDSNYVRLESFKAEPCLVLEMERPEFNRASAIVDVVSSLEGVQLTQDVLESLIRRNQSDLRKSLLELQFWVQSGESKLKFSQSNDSGYLWWGLSKFLYHSDVIHFIGIKRRKRKRWNDLFDSSDDEEIAPKKVKLSLDSSKCSNTETINKTKPDPTISYYHTVLDAVSVLDAFRLSSNVEPVPCMDYKPKDSLCLEENMEDVSVGSKSLGDQIFSELIDLSAKAFFKNCRKSNDVENICHSTPSYDEVRWRKCHDEASNELSVLVPIHNGRDKRSLRLDYLPLVRNICRLERARLTSNTKRKNRFYHYLNNLGVELTDDNLETNCEIFEC